MPGNPKLKELSAVLVGIENEWQELANLLKGQAQSPFQTETAHSSAKLKRCGTAFRY